MLASSLTLFLLITARMSGCILFNPLLGRRGIPGLVKGGFILMLSLSAFALTPLPEQVPDTLLTLALTFLLELFLGYVLGEDLYAALIEMFIDCTVLGVKLCMPILAAELMGQVGMGILMKAIPQINVFAINIELKVIIGLMLTFLFLIPISEFLLEAEIQMLVSLQRILPLMSG